MTKKLFVGNLSYGITTDFLINTFSDFGNVQEVKIITDRETQRSKGFAFVLMNSESEVQSAIINLNGREIEGRAMVVSVAKEMEPRTRSSQSRW